MVGRRHRKAIEMKTKIKEQNLNVIDLFKQFCKERHAEDKGRNFDMLQEIYAKTELFDLSFLPKSAPNMSPFEQGEHVYKGDKLEELIFADCCFKDVILPFENQFIKLGTAGADEMCMYLREFNPFTITGTVYIKANTFTLNMPFQILVESGELRSNLSGVYSYANMLRSIKFSEEQVQKAIEGLLELSLGQVTYVIDTVCNLPKHSIATDTPKHAEYYTRKHGTTIKAIKPIYYVLDKKEEKEKRNYNRIKPLGSIAFDHSFKVIGHWRKISPHTYGKNRNGEYVVTGMTWVKEHTRGEGDLIKKIRVLK